jgi:hypothetical protein
MLHRTIENLACTSYLNVIADAGNDTQSLQSSANDEANSAIFEYTSREEVEGSAPALAFESI